MDERYKIALTFSELVELDWALTRYQKQLVEELDYDYCEPALQMVRNQLRTVSKLRDKLDEALVAE